MKKILFLSLFSFLILGCKKENMSSKVQMEIKNSSNFEISKIDLKANSNNTVFDLLKIENIKLNEVKTVSFNLATFDKLQDGNYSITAYLSNGTSKEFSFGYFTNKIDLKTNYTVDVSSNGIDIK